MAFPNSLFLVILFSFLWLLPSTQSRLSNYYKKTCPQFHKVMQKVIADKQLSAPTTAAAILRLFFHDCFVKGCDASILVASNAFKKSELDSDINLSLAGDAFDLIARAKTALQLQCPDVVSCSDILALSARDLVIMVGVPSMKSFWGERTASKTSEYDPAYNPVYAEGLRKLCANYTKAPEMSAFIDVFTPGKFDNMYYKNLQRGLGLLLSDQAMLMDNRTRPFVVKFCCKPDRIFLFVYSFHGEVERL
ncbi:hypothetical protein CRYUN_Cryun21dG0074600 [Craigia yunnanensis]